MNKRDDADKFQLIRELPLEELLFTTVIMLIGLESKDWCRYEQDPQWWELRLWARRN